MCVQLDKNQEQGSCLNEFDSHRVLESCSKAYTVQELRNFMAGIDRSNCKMDISIIEILLFNYRIDWKTTISVDWDKEKDIEKRLDIATKTLSEATIASKKAALDATSAQNLEELALKEQLEASRAAEKARLAEREFLVAKRRSQETLEELSFQEKKLIEMKEHLMQCSNEISLGIVKRNKAKAELVIILSKDPLPLRKAKISREASFKKHVRAGKTASEAKFSAVLSMKKAKKLRLEAQKSKEEALRTGKIAETAIPTAQSAYETIRCTWERLKNEKHRKKFEGTIFYFERELQVAKRFLPKNKFIAVSRAAKSKMENLRLPVLLA